MTLTIRRAVERDAEAVRAVGLRTWPATYYSIAGEDYVQAGLAKWWSVEATVTAIRARRVTVAELDGQVVGMASVGPEGDHLVLWKLYVLPEHHGQGIGSRLLESVLSEAAGSYPEIRLSYTVGNAPASAFYQAKGFVETHRERNGGGVPDQVWMSREIEPADADAGPAEAEEEMQP